MMSTEQITHLEQNLLDRVEMITDLVAGLHRDPDAGAAADPLDTAATLRLIAEYASSALKQAVPLAREMQEASWAQIGDALGMSRQGAYDQFGRAQ